MASVPPHCGFDPEAGPSFVLALLEYTSMPLLPPGSWTLLAPKVTSSLRGSHLLVMAWCWGHLDDSEEASSTLYSCSEVAPQHHNTQINSLSLAALPAEKPQQAVRSVPGGQLGRSGRFSHGGLLSDSPWHFINLETGRLGRKVGA